MESTTLLKLFVPAVLTFFIGIAITPTLSNFFYRSKLWKRSGRGNPSDNPDISEGFQKIYNSQKELTTPRIGGVIIWLSVLLATLSIWIISQIFPTEITEKFDFLSRNQTWLPLFALVFASLIGLFDDLLQILGKGKKFIDGLSRSHRILIVTVISLVGGLWFFLKLDVSSIAIPFDGVFQLGWVFVPVFMVVMLGTFSGGVIDGLDGLAGGVMAIAFGSMATIAYFQNQIDIAAFCLVVSSGILAFLWFNIPPARFYMGETGMIGLTVTLAIVAFLTDTVLILPIIAFPLVISSFSSIVQFLARRFFKKKVFLVAPLHHHFQALGWSPEKITMRYWVIAIMCAIIGVIVAMAG